MNTDAVRKGKLCAGRCTASSSSRLSIPVVDGGRGGLAAVGADSLGVEFVGLALGVCYFAVFEHYACFAGEVIPFSV